MGFCVSEAANFVITNLTDRLRIVYRLFYSLELFFACGESPYAAGQNQPDMKDSVANHGRLANGSLGGTQHRNQFRPMLTRGLSVQHASGLTNSVLGNRQGFL